MQPRSLPVRGRTRGSIHVARSWTCGLRDGAVTALRRLVASAGAAALLASCSIGQPPRFCGVTDDARTAVANVTPDHYPAEAAKHVDAVRRAADELSGEQGDLASKVADDLQGASRAKAGSMEFTLAYNAFVKDSNDFDHAYCNEPEGP